MPAISLRRDTSLTEIMLHSHSRTPAARSSPMNRLAYCRVTPTSEAKSLCVSLTLSRTPFPPFYMHKLLYLQYKFALREVRSHFDDFFKDRQASFIASVLEERISG